MKKYVNLALMAVFMLCFSVVLAESTGTDGTSYQKPLPEVRVKKEEQRVPGPGEVWYNGKIKSAEEVRQHEEFLRLQTNKDVTKRELLLGQKLPPNTNMADLDEVDREKLMVSREELKKRVMAGQEAFRESLKARMQPFLTEVKAKKEEFRNATGEMKRKFWDNAQNMIGQRFESAFTNLERMQDRVEALIEKLEDEDKDTGAASEYLDDSKDKLADAKDKLAEVKKLLPASGEQVTAEVFEKIKLGARETKDLVKESHNALVQAIKELKGLKSDTDDDNEDENENE